MLSLEAGEPSAVVQSIFKLLPNPKPGVSVEDENDHVPRLEILITNLSAVVYFSAVTPVWSPL